MEQKGILMGAALGVGVGVGIGLASSPTVSRWAGVSQGVTAEMLQQELMRMIVDGRDTGVNFDQFPYFLSEQTRVLLTSAAYVHLKQVDFSVHTQNLSPASRAILLSGPMELYQQMLAKALAQYFEAKLLLLDVTNFSLKIQSKYATSNKNQSIKRSMSATTLEKVSGLFASFSVLPQTVELIGAFRRQGSFVDTKSRTSESGKNISKHRRNASASANIGDVTSPCAPSSALIHKGGWPFSEKLFIQSLYKVLVSVSRSNPIILYIRNADDILHRSPTICLIFQKLLRRLSGPVLILGSRILESGNDYREIDEKIRVLFPYNIEIKPPAQESHLVSWKCQLEEDMKILQYQDNRNHIMGVLAVNDLECDDLDAICLADTTTLSKYIEEIVVLAISYHLMNNKDPVYRNGKLVISSKSLSHGLSIFQEGKDNGHDTSKFEAKVDAIKDTPTSTTSAMVSENKRLPDKPADLVEGIKKDGDDSSMASEISETPPDNEFEKRIRPEVIPAGEIGVTFDDIGALNETKESLQELVMLPLRRPDLFKGGILKPCRGILLFGPPGTGKTMLAKAIAKEAGASFINVSMSTVTSKWFGEDEKNVRALFTLAAKVSPTIIFVDEVDSMLGQRTRAGEHEAMRKIKNEFMTHWDGLSTKPGERILVLAATNRPFDLDEAIIRRFERRIMVGLPSIESREQILRTFLSKEKVEDGLDFKELAHTTEGYSGSDLKNLCTTAAYRPVRELIQREREKELKRKATSGESSMGNKEPDEENNAPIFLRPLNMDDMRQAKNQVAPSFAAEGSIMTELKQWNELYGEGGSRKLQQQQLSYFL